MPNPPFPCLTLACPNVPNVPISQCPKCPNVPMSQMSQMSHHSWGNSPSAEAGWLLPSAGSHNWFVTHTHVCALCAVCNQMCGRLLEVQLRVRVSAQQVCCCAWCSRRLWLGRWLSPGTHAAALLSLELPAHVSRSIAPKSCAAKKTLRR